MTEELIQIGISLPNDFLKYCDDLFENTDHSSRSDVIRSAILKYIQYYEWMKEVKGKRVGIFEMIYNPLERGLSASVTRILGESNKIILSSIQVHIKNNDYLRVIIMRGKGEHLVDLADNLMSQRGIKYVKLTTLNITE